MQNINIQDLNKANDIITRMSQEHIDEGFSADHIIWTGRKAGNEYEFEISIEGLVTTGWSDGKTVEGFINFIVS